MVKLGIGSRAYLRVKFVAYGCAPQHSASVGLVLLSPAAVRCNNFANCFSKSSYMLIINLV
jgi:hypothetical protein